MEARTTKMATGTEQGLIRKGYVREVAGIKALLDGEVARGAVLARTVAELSEHLRDFHLFVDEAGIGGCCALHIDLENLAEIRSLVVRGDLRGRGIGHRLVQACVDEAADLGIAHVYALTRSPGFFYKAGFRQIDKHELPSKVFRDCVRCTMFPDCDETAVMLDMDTGGEQR
jgi:amino-acid N-acetyltransferase